MVNGITNTSSLQLISALQAFKKSNANSLKNDDVKETDDSLDVSDNSSKTDSIYSFKGNENVNKPQSSVNSQFIQDVKKFATQYGNVVEDSDIQYAMRYGRSILIDTKA